MWSLDDGQQVTPMQSRWTGYRLHGGRVYVVPGSYDLAPSSSAGLGFLFARSQTEQVDNVEAFRAKFQSLSSAVGPTGLPALVAESEDAIAGEVGTYVVNRDGNQPAAVIRLAP